MISIWSGARSRRSTLATSTRCASSTGRRASGGDDRLLCRRGRGHSGHEGLRQYFVDVEDKWSWYRVDIGELEDAGDGRVIARGAFHAKGTTSGATTTTTCTWIYVIRDGLIEEMHNIREE
jgi:ketosteroid isomerase-like protein